MSELKADSGDDDLRPAFVDLLPIIGDQMDPVKIVLQLGESTVAGKLSTFEEYMKVALDDLERGKLSSEGLVAIQGALHHEHIERHYIYLKNVTIFCPGGPIRVAAWRGLRSAVTSISFYGPAHVAKSY